MATAALLALYTLIAAVPLEPGVEPVRMTEMLRRREPEALFGPGKVRLRYCPVPGTDSVVCVPVRYGSITVRR